VWLYCPLEEIVNRLKKDEKSSDYRPSLTGLGLIEEVSHVLSLREPLYREVAHIAVDVSNKSPEIISGNILKAFCS
jgi:shikimate kinase